MNKSNITLTALAFAIVVIIAETAALVSAMALKAPDVAEIRKELVSDNEMLRVFNVYERASDRDSWKFRYVEGYNKPRVTEQPDPFLGTEFRMFLKQPATRELFE